MSQYPIAVNRNIGGQTMNIVKIPTRQRTKPEKLRYDEKTGQQL
jgi:hypothetical protein